MSSCTVRKPCLIKKALRPFLVITTITSFMATLLVRKPCLIKKALRLNLGWVFRERKFAL